MTSKLRRSNWIWMSKEFKNAGRSDFCCSKPLFRDSLEKEHVLLRATCLQEVFIEPICSHPFCKWFWSGFWEPINLLIGYLEHTMENYFLKNHRLWVSVYSLKPYICWVPKYSNSRSSRGDKHFPTKI